MRKVILFLTPLLILTILFLVIVLVINKDNGKGALQVTSIPSSQVFINDKFIGNTPLCLCDLPELLKTGEYNIKLIPVQTGLGEIEQKIRIYQGVLTVVDRTFEKQAAASSGSTITLSPIDNKNKSELLVISFPDKAQVILDSNIAGNTPLLIKDITPSDHEIKLLKDGYSEKTIKVKTTGGKQLEATISLGIKIDIATSEIKASRSSVLSQKIKILETPTGYLRVRSEPSLSGNQVGLVNPGDSVELISEKDGWYEIKLTDGKTGWISSDYANKE
ncbi:MAG: SH3 domain-containing protein [Patescibacteria group bacterium]